MAATFSPEQLRTANGRGSADHQSSCAVRASALSLIGTGGPHRALGRLLAVWLVCGAATSCATPPAAVRSARNGDLVTLRRTIAEEKRSRRLDDDRARAIAKGLLEGEISRSRGPSGAAFIAALRGCAEPLEDALDQRAETKDAVGGEAALILVERNAWCGPSPASFAKDDDGAWRALAAERATGGSDSQARQQFLTDGDQRARRAAARAAGTARDPGDLKTLLEAGRADPDPLTRSRALRAVGAIGGRGVAQALRDRFETAEEADQLAIVEAWAEPATFDGGGEQQLETVVHQKPGLVAIVAARALVGARGFSAEAVQTNQEIFGRLAQASRDGSEGERRLALQLLPSEHPETEQLLLEASKDGNAQVQLIALVRLAGRPAHRDRAVAELVKLSAAKSPLRHQARAALAVYGNNRVLRVLAEALASPDAQERRLAGYSLIRLGASEEAAPLLADDDEGVRRDVACRMLAPVSAD